ncbi:MAG: metalloregulator ArsR/SmtB family transcription factor [Candidatus Omnitrophica bacterium]|nr:metalloregulator ArsR/SmtB family transcription factor [Candidatus Omnitrophota bacterium]
MKIKKARQILKSFADDTRLRIINLLNKQELNVTELCEVLQSNQSNVSKHLARLRLTGVVGDKREGLNVYYCLMKPNNKAHQELLNSITVGLADLETFKRDLEMLKELKKSAKTKVTRKGSDKK